ncbi:MAG TPA: hypothetical protein PL119_03950 [Bacteroidales bacterium]|nr:hypothetical protein [Bacteroidales bacterium]
MKNRIAFVSLGFLLLIGVVWGLVLYLFIPSWWFPAYPAIPAAFVAIDLLENFFLKADDSQQQKWMKSIVIQRITRWGILLVTLVLLIALAHPPKLSLLVSFMALFLLYSVLSILLLYSEIRKKK